MDNFKTLIWDTMIKALIGDLVKAVPFLAFGPFGAILNFFVFRLTDQLYAGIKLQFDMERIWFKNQDLLRVYSTAAINLNDIAKTKGVDSDEYKDARAQHVIALGALIRFK